MIPKQRALYDVSFIDVMGILDAALKKKWLIEDQGGARSIPVCCHTTVVYKFKCDLYDAGYVGFTRCHLHKHVQ